MASGTHACQSACPAPSSTGVHAMSRINRRKFLAAGAACSTLILAGTRASGRVLGANDTIRVGVIGLNGRGKLHIEMATTTPGLTLAAVCDVDPAVLARTLESAGAQETRPGRPEGPGLRRPPQDAGLEGHRRRDRGHAQPLAFAGRHLGLPGGQGRAGREARLAQRLGGAATGRGRPQVGPASSRPAPRPGPIPI